MKNANYCVLFIVTLFGTITAQSDKKCVTPDMKNGECIDLKICDPLRTLLENQRHIESVRILLQKSFCGYVGTSPQVCCPMENPGGPVTNETMMNYNVRPINNGTGSQSSVFPSKSKCGVVFLPYRDRIVGGVPSELGAWPWMTAIGYRRISQKDSPVTWNCGGTLITDRYVLTAAHCTTRLPSGLKPVMARLGDLDLNPTINDGATPLDVPIEKIISHARYFVGYKLVNDISLLKLKESVTFTKHIQPICLPSPADMANINWEKGVLTVAGWGSTNSDKLYDQILPLNTRLMEVEIPLTNREKCKQAYKSEDKALIDDTVICAGMPMGGEDSCRGDSGGPLMMYKKEHYYLAGIVSYGPKMCGVPGIPGVYTQVSSFINWIEEQIIHN